MPSFLAKKAFLAYNCKLSTCFCAFLTTALPLRFVLESLRSGVVQEINRMFVAVSIFEVANDMAEEVKKAFVARPHLVDKAVGFLEMKVLSPQENLNEIWVTTFWEEESNYQDWYKNHMKESHQGIPKGLKLVPESTKVRFFQQVTN